jgi:hypothetical protein
MDFLLWPRLSATLPLALSRTLLQAADRLASGYGSSTATWTMPVTCPVTTPPSCDQIVATDAGAISLPPQPFDNRGTFTKRSR